MAAVVQGFGAGDFAALAKLAFQVYNNVRESRTNFGKLNIDVECLLVSIGSLDKGYTQELILEYIEKDDSEIRQQEVRALRDGLNSVIMPFYALFDSRTSAFRSPDGSKQPRITNRSGVLIYVEGPNSDPSQPKDRPWRRWQVTSWIQRLRVAFELKDLAELRARFAVQAANLNLFMTRLTHTQLQRQTELLTLKLAEQSLLRDNFRYSLDLSEATDDFREDVASYVKFLLDGGKPFSDTELRHRKAEGRYNRMSKGRASGSLNYERIHALERISLEEKEQKSSGESIEAILDDDARIKLALARQRLALADIKDEDTGLEIDTTAVETVTINERPSSARRASEQVTVMASPRAPRPNELRRRKTSTDIVCDNCERNIRADKTFYRCQSGRCGPSGDSFDICGRCYGEGERCPGYDKGVCLSMDKLMWRDE